MLPENSPENSTGRKPMILSRLIVFLILLMGPWHIGCPTASAQTSVETASAATTAAQGKPSAAAGTNFHFNNRRTTAFGPAYADIMTKPANMLACKAPSGKSLAYALCYYSGPAVATGAQGNPALPCRMSADGKSASCTCYKLTTNQAPDAPYMIDINAILNLDVYRFTVASCGHDGSKCGRGSAITPPACTAANSGTMMPKGNLISVFSPLKAASYSTAGKPGSNYCSMGKYAGCMTAPCRDTGKTDDAGNALVDCKCPIYDGPFEVGQATVPCDANALTPHRRAPAAERRQTAMYGRPPTTRC